MPAKKSENDSIVNDKNIVTFETPDTDSIQSNQKYTDDNGTNSYSNLIERKANTATDKPKSRSETKAECPKDSVNSKAIESDQPRKEVKVDMSQEHNHTHIHLNQNTNFNLNNSNDMGEVLNVYNNFMGTN